MANFFTERLNPAWYHGKGKKGPYFDGWYYKLVNHDESKVFAIIPGVFIDKTHKDTHAFIQVLDGIKGQAYYHTIKSFSAKDDAFDVSIGNSHFNLHGLTLDYHDGDQVLEGTLSFGDLLPYPVTPAAPGIMGWYGWLPFMECNHALLSFDHAIQGTLNLYDDMIDFTGGRGYIEKDWGTNFPRGYVWMQSNHFSTPNTSLSASIAVVPSVGRTFPGFIVALLWQGQVLTFATYNNTKVSHLSVNDATVEWVLYNKQYELSISATRATGGLLKGPQKEAMHMRVDETMQAHIMVTLCQLDGFRKRVIFQDMGRNGGLEVVGDLGMLLKA